MRSPAQKNTCAMCLIRPRITPYPFSRTSGYKLGIFVSSIFQGKKFAMGNRLRNRLTFGRWVFDDGDTVVWQQSGPNFRAAGSQISIGNFENGDRAWFPAPFGNGEIQWCGNPKCGFFRCENIFFFFCNSGAEILTREPRGNYMAQLAVERRTRTMWNFLFGVVHHHLVTRST